MPRPPYAAGTPEAREAGRRGGAKKAGTTALASKLGLTTAFTDARFNRYRSAAENFARLHVRDLARTAGGGTCGPAPSSVVWSAALQLAGSRFAFEVLGDLALGSRLADASRANLLSAFELCAREAATRPRQNPHTTAAALFARPATTSPAQAVSALPTTTSTSGVNGAPKGGQEGG